MWSSSRAAGPLALIALATAPLAALAQTCPVAVVEAEMSPSQAVKEGGFGTVLSFSSDTLVSAAPLEDAGSVKDAGAVYVMTRSGSSWQEQARLVSPTPASLDHFGLGLAVDQDTVAVGAPFAGQVGAVTVFVRSGSSWTVQATLSPPGPSSALFGWDVELVGDKLAVGAPGYNNGAGVSSGAVFVYLRSGSSWSLDGTLVPSDSSAKDYFGHSVGIDGTTVIGGAYGKGSANQGGAYIFIRNMNGWSEQANLVELPALAQRLFGYEVAVEGDLAIVGAPSTALFVPQAGSAYVYQRVAGIWTLLAELQASDGLPLDFFGGRMRLDSGRLAISARDNDRAYLFLQVGLAWVERLTLTTEELGLGRFEGLALDGNTVLVGSPYDSLVGIAGSGASASLRFTSGANPSVPYCVAGISASGCLAAISACGAPSATSSGGFALVASNLEGDKDGLFFIGTNGRQANPWGNGSSFQCVVPPIFRGGMLQGTGTSGLCDGVTKQDINGLWCPVGCPSPAKNPGAGALVQAQFWYRDPFNTSNQTTSLSHALEFTVGP